MNQQYNIPFSILHLTETDSTNSYLKKIGEIRPIEEFTTVLTDFQRFGHGQEGNSWESENSKNLLFSLILYPDFCKANQQFYLSQLISLAVKDTLEQYVSDISIKWPNDIYWKKKKICGILIENNLYGPRISQSIVGIGININQETFRSNAVNPISLYQITGKVYDRESILIEFLMRAKEYYNIFKDNGLDLISQRYSEALYRKDGYHPYRDKNGEFMAKITCILPSGTFVLTDEEGIERHYEFQEVTYLPEE